MCLLSLQSQNLVWSLLVVDAQAHQSHLLIPVSTAKDVVVGVSTCILSV